MADFDIRAFLRDLDVLLARVPSDMTEIATAGGWKTSAVQESLAKSIQALESLKVALDPIKQPASLFDPSDPLKIGHVIAGALLLEPRYPLEDLPRFWGAGVYALYYNGSFDAYRPIRRTDHPIYVGKADPKTTHAKTPRDQGETLSKRLAEHAKTIRSAENLAISDFGCRYLVVTSAWQKAAEDHLIAMYKPIWNNEMRICYGFGKHGDSSTTRANERSPWDMLHPGRKWAAGNKPNRKSIAEITSDIAAHFRLHPPLTK